MTATTAPPGLPPDAAGTARRAAAATATGGRAPADGRGSRPARRLGMGWWVMTVLSLLVVLYVVWGYGMQPLGRLVAPHMREVFQANKAGIYLHVFGAVLALGLGPFQFWAGLRSRAPRVHRWIGRVYLLAGVGVGGLAGLFMATKSAGGIGAQLGFGMLALAWLATGWLAYRSIRRGDVAAHRRWMIRNFALTFAGVTLRVLLTSGFASGLRFEIFYPTISWLCWVPNLLVAEAMLRRRPALPAR